MDLSALSRPLPEVLSRKKQKVSRIFTVEELDLKFSNSSRMTYERIAGGNGAVMAIPFDGRFFYLTSEYACGFERYELGFVKGKIDDGEEKIIPFFPFETELPCGSHRLAITIYGHRRNAFGPFYLNEKYPERTGPYQFKVYESSKRQLVQCGLLDSPVIYYK